MKSRIAVICLGSFLSSLIVVPVFSQPALSPLGLSESELRSVEDKSIDQIALQPGMSVTRPLEAGNDPSSVEGIGL
ncbi:MAG: hypothetical protein KC931_17765, partial [Candidatus Omnitrophica bacterium]|nr:hypothetical protein [Candidatus Omnitrophota bacterium]